MDSVIHAPVFLDRSSSWFCKCGEYLCDDETRWRDSYFEHLENV